MSDEGARKRSTSFVLSDALINALDSLKPVYGVRSRGAVVEQLLEYLLHQDEEEITEPETSQPSEPIQEASSLVLIRRQDQNEAENAQDALAAQSDAPGQPVQSQRVLSRVASICLALFENVVANSSRLCVHHRSRLRTAKQIPSSRPFVMTISWPP